MKTGDWSSDVCSSDLTNIRSIKKFSFEEIFVSKVFCCQPEQNTAIRADNILAVSAAAADVFQITTTSDRFHDWKQHHHGLGADSLPI